MSVTDKFRDKRILIWGYGREGKSTEAFLKEHCSPALVEIFEGSREDIREDAFDYIFKSPGIVMEEDHPKYTSQTDVFLEAFRDRTVGITGTKGKSTTSAMLYKVLSENLSKEVLLLGNIGLPCLDYYGQMQEKDTLAVFEMSCHQLAHAFYAPHVSVFLNLYEEHLDYYKTLEAYFTAKSHIVSRQVTGDLAFVGENVPPILSKARVKVVTRNPEEDLPLSIFGDHNQLNAQFVLQIATEVFGCSKEGVKQSLQSFTGLPHRLQPLGNYREITWYDDSISTIPEAAIGAVNSLPAIGTILIGGMDRGIQYGILEAFMKERKDIRFICMYASGERILKELLQEQGKAENWYLCKDLEEAVQLAKTVTPKGMGCVLSPAAPSYGYFKNFEHRGEVFAELVKR